MVGEGWNNANEKVTTSIGLEVSAHDEKSITDGTNNEENEGEAVEQRVGTARKEVCGIQPSG